MFLVGRTYKPKLKPVGPHIASHQHQTAFLYMPMRVTHETNLRVRPLLLSHSLIHIRTTHL